MGTFGPGNFHSDAALDYLQIEVIQPLVAKVEAIVQHPQLAQPDEPAAVEVLVAVELLCVICETCDAGVLPKPELVETCRSTYLRVWDDYIDELAPTPSFKKKRRSVIDGSFARLLKLSKRWHKRNES